MNEDEENTTYQENNDNIQGQGLGSNFDKEVKENKRGVGRPRIPDSEKALYQRVPIKFETYKKLKQITSDTGVTFTDLIEAMLSESKLQ